MAANAKVEGNCIAADLGVVAALAVAVMNVDSSELVVDGFENLLAEEGHILDDVGISTRHRVSAGSVSAKCGVSCDMSFPNLTANL